MTPQPETPQDDSLDIVKRAMTRFKAAAEAESEIRKMALEDVRFSVGEQWPQDIKNNRDIEKRPCLTINRLPQFLRQITNDQRQNRPSIKIDPVDDEGDVETAKVLQGMVRHIEYASNAEVAYDTASDGQCRGGFGYFRVITEYCDPMSFDQDIRIKRIRDPFSVYLDPSYQEPDGSDANWGFVVDEMSKDSFKDQYPKAKLSGMDDWTSVGAGAPQWLLKDGCRIAEYFEKDFETKTIYKFSDGTVLTQLPEQLPEGITLIDQRETQVPMIKWYKINGIEILEQTEWLGTWIPIIPVLGDEVIVDGKKMLEGVIRHAKDPQRMYNYWSTAITETIALAPKAPFIGAEGQFEGHEQKWQTANNRSHPYLEYKPKSLGGEQLPPPQRNVYEPPTQAITQALQIAAEDLKATTGIYDASLGNRSNEQSGVAIQRRNHQSETANFHLSDNFKRSLRHVGRIIVELIPVIYDGPRVVRSLGADGVQEIVTVNKIFNKNGQPTIYQLDKGKYDVTVDTGPSFQTKRQEAVASMLDMTRAVPNVMAPAMDLMVKNMDWPGAQEIAKRLRKMLPPGIAEPEQSDQQMPIPPEVQNQIAQMTQLIQQQHGLLMQQNDLIKNKKIEMESKERIETMKAQNDLTMELMKHDAKHAQTAFIAEIDMLKKRMELLGGDRSPEQDFMAGSNGAAPNSQPQPIGGQTPS